LLLISYEQRDIHGSFEGDCDSSSTGRGLFTRISLYQPFFPAHLYSIHDIVVRPKRIKASSSTCKSSFTSSQLHTFLSNKHQHPDHSTHSKLIQTTSTLSIRSDKQTHQWTGNKFNKGDVGKSSVLAAVTLLFRESLSLSQGRGPRATPTLRLHLLVTREISQLPVTRKCEYPANKHNFICFTCHIPASPSSCAYHDLCSATYADHAETQR
jgi:hypothetical protein